MSAGGRLEMEFRFVTSDADRLRCLVAAYGLILRTDESVQPTPYGVRKHADPGNVPVEARTSRLF